MPHVVRPLEAAELGAAAELSRLAFGGARPNADAPAPTLQAARTTWGSFDGDRLAAAAVDRHQEHWFGGRLVACSGLADVSVAPADRGRGHARTLLTTVLAAARDRGAAVMTLFPSAPALYRGLGCEQAGSLTWWDLPTTALAGLRMPAGSTARAAGAADNEAIRALYEEAAHAGSGYLHRAGPLFPVEPVDGLDGVTLAIDSAGTVQGFSGWDRGPGWGGDTRLTVYDLIARTGAATLALLAALGNWGSVIETIRIRLPDPDPVQWLLPTRVLRAFDAQPWMLRLIDAPAAVAARGWPLDLDTVVELDIVDDACPWNAGRHRLEIHGGEGFLTHEGAAHASGAAVSTGAAPAAGAVTIGARGLALLYAGGVTTALLRRAGLLTGGDARTDRALDAIAAGPRPTLLDHF